MGGAGGGSVLVIVYNAQGVDREDAQMNSLRFCVERFGTKPEIFADSAVRLRRDRRAFEA